MVKKYLVKAVFATALAMMFCATLFATVKTQKAGAAGESYTLSFTGSSVTIEGTDGWWTTATQNAGIYYNGNEKIFTINLKEADDVYYGNPTYWNCVEGHKYIISFDLKKNEASSENECAFHVFVDKIENGQKVDSAMIKEWQPATDSWQNVKYVFTAFSDASDMFHFIDGYGWGAKKSVFDLKNFTITETSEEKTVTANAAIGTLPSIPEKPGYTGVWTIDGKVITAESVYDYTENKTAVPSYKVNNYTLTFGEGENAVQKQVTYGEPIGELPPVSNKQGYSGVWTVGGAEITSETRYFETENKTAEAKYTANEYTLTFGEGENAKILTVVYGKTIADALKANEWETLPDVTGSTPAGYHLSWVLGGEEITSAFVYEYAENKVAVIKQTAIQYTVTFKAEGVTVATRTYTVEDKSIENLPVVPEKDGYTAAWETYELTTGDITVNAVYTPVEKPNESQKSGCGAAIENVSYLWVVCLGAALAILVKTVLKKKS